MKKFAISFVCTGNSCRSPMAEMILKNLCKKRGIEDVKVTSMGLSADEGYPMTDKSKQALKQCRIPMTVFKTKRVTVDRMRKCDLTICMTKQHTLPLAIFDNVYCMEQLTGHDVIDPFGKSFDVYLDTCKQMIDDMEKILAFIENNYLTNWRNK